MTTADRETIIAHNLAIVEQHIHNENPEDVDKAVALYTDDVVWESPARGQILRGASAVKEAYLKLFQTARIHSITPLRRFATEQFVFDDAIFHSTIINDPAGMPGLQYSLGSRLSTRLSHVFEIRDGKICREIVYEIHRQEDSIQARDEIPAGAPVIRFDNL